MSNYLIDYENVQAGSPLCGIENLTEHDNIFLFYSDSANKMKEYYWNLFNNSKCETHLVKLKNKGSNALDFYISVQVGMCIGKGIDCVAIISNDKGFNAVIDYSEILLSESCRNVIIASCIEEARQIFDKTKKQQKKVCNLLKNTVTIKDVLPQMRDVEQKVTNKKSNNKSTQRKKCLFKYLSKYATITKNICSLNSLSK